MFALTLHAEWFSAWPDRELATRTDNKKRARLPAPVDVKNQ
ncbi:hypothetical protein ALP10_101004 [Pseudomonas syringae pv. helianthi]|nr:hypothetical protein ALO44_101137 [Pseudomonas syringae pv. tagetis]RMR06348.1 hypothetical protein ALP93_100892 [Pseudomonas syringae pv. helianthi]RMV52125.1 hypothetical protein ALP10_101004 [Pseudomonas syringae pv. helianthi]RMW15909.1 hypothetical protein ALO98_100934 [Pseudomonas syringae pv. tagetis]RMW18586.1 hypothetical protein ALO97_101058 [Pseudomonas syringae pv. tagetis]